MKLTTILNRTHDGGASAAMPSPSDAPERGWPSEKLERLATPVEIDEILRGRL